MWPGEGGPEVEGSWAGGWVREKVPRAHLHPQIPLLNEQMGISSNSCPTQDLEPRRGCEDRAPRARAWSHFEIVDILTGSWWERELGLWIQMFSLVIQTPEVFHQSLSLPWGQSLSRGHEHTHTAKNGDSHLQHRLSLMLVVSLFMSNVWSLCKLFLFVVIICSWLLTISSNK